MKRLFIISIFIFLCLDGFSQTQRVSGRAEDKFRNPLSGAGVILLKDSIVATSLADSTGYFVFENVQPGRYGLRVSFTGYQFFQQEILITSSRAIEVIVSLEEIPSVLEEVEISARTLNDQLGGQAITIEKALRVPANFFDPVRVITSYPGVMTANDQNNTIVVRGNSPAGLLWRINGLDVVNPNHLANAGTLSDKPAVYGGGVNIISAQLLDRTDFYGGSLPVRYGNALSGVVDMNLREGDKTENHYTLQASLIGLDASAEGPVGKKQNTSFLVNYRYSTVGLLSAMGAKFGDEDIRFQDLTFSINSDLSKNRKLSLFGFYGNSKNIFEAKDPQDRTVDKDQFDIDYSSRNFGTGLTFSQSIKQLTISSGVSFSGSDQQRDQILNGYYRDRFDAEKYITSAFGRINASINSTSLETGITISYMHDNLVMLDPDNSLALYGNAEGVLLQSYAQWRIFLSDKWIAQTAMRHMYYTYNSTSSLEPRISLEFFPTSQSSFKFSYNLVSQLQQAGTYLNDNKDLEMSKSHHLDLGYLLRTDNGLKFSANTYYQKLFDIPVQKNPSSYSLLNSIETVALPDLVSNGTGDNYGLEVLTEKSFFDKSYFILGGSYYHSLYKGSDEINRHTRFDGNYTINLTYGKEWTRSKKQSLRAFGLSSRILYLGGLRETQIMKLSYGTGFILVEDVQHAFENKLKDYFRMDLRLNWRKNKKGYTRTIALDIQNVLNTQNEVYNYYDNVKGKIMTQYQLGLIPVLVYRIDF